MNREADTKCAVKNCENHSDQGRFVGVLCSPCYTFIATGEGVYSQAFRNSRDMVNQAVEAEREACWQACKKVRDSDYCAEEWAEQCMAAIRARGDVPQSRQSSESEEDM